MKINYLFLKSLLLAGILLFLNHTILGQEVKTNEKGTIRYGLK